MSRLIVMFFFRSKTQNVKKNSPVKGLRSQVQIVNFGTKGPAILCSIYSISSLSKRIWLKKLFSHFHEKMQDYVLFVVKDIAVRSWGQHCLHLFCYSIIPS